MSDTTKGFCIPESHEHQEFDGYYVVPTEPSNPDPAEFSVSLFLSYSKHDFKENYNVIFEQVVDFLSAHVEDASTEIDARCMTFNRQSSYKSTLMCDNVGNIRKFLITALRFLQLPDTGDYTVRICVGTVLATNTKSIYIYAT